MCSFIRLKNDQRGWQLAFHITPWDVLTGLPAGVLIFMGTVLFSTLFSRYEIFPDLLPLIVLAVVSTLVGLLAGITRLRHGPATGLSAGLIAAGILFYLWLAVRPGDEFNRLVIGPLGMIVTIIFSPIGGWLGAKLRKAL
jgi:hypothetical protein